MIAHVNVESFYVPWYHHPQGPEMGGHHRMITKVVKTPFG